MADLQASARRLMATYRGERADRVPMCSPISWQPTGDIDHEKPGGWRAEPGFIRLARLVQEYCDPHPLHCPVKIPAVFAKYSYQRFLEAPDEYIEALPVEQVGPKRTRHTTVCHTPKGDLFWSYDEDEGIETRWDMRKPINCPRDVQRMLSVPYRFDRPASAAFEPLRQYRRQAGRDAMGGVNINSMVAMLCGVMDFERLLEWTITEPGLIKDLAQAWLTRTAEKVDYLLDQGVGPIWHFNGVERASPPMMGPRQWRELVEPYDGEIMRRIKARDPRAIIHVHCHGRVGTLLESFIAMGVDSTDPVEPPPQGDIAFADAKRKAAGRLVLLGNMEFVDMETLAPDEIEAKVKRALSEGGKERMVLYPSATPHERHTEKLLANAERYIEAGLRYGAF